MQKDHAEKDKATKRETLQALQQIVDNVKKVRENNNTIMQLLRDIKVTLRSIAL